MDLLIALLKSSAPWAAVFVAGGGAMLALVRLIDARVKHGIRGEHNATVLTAKIAAALDAHVKQDHAVDGERWRSLRELVETKVEGLRTLMHDVGKSLDALHRRLDVPPVAAATYPPRTPQGEEEPRDG